MPSTWSVREFRTILAGTALLSFNAGFVNVIAILSTFSSTVSHQSGNVSKFSIALGRLAHSGAGALLNSGAQGGGMDFMPSDLNEDAFFFFTVILAFGLGAFIAALIVGDSKFVLGRSYWSAILVESAAFFTAFYLLHNRNRAGEYAASFACGVQNSLTSNYAGAVVRTTHLTGTITDVFSILGVHVATRGRNADIWKLQFYVPSIFFFALGGFAGTYSQRHIGVYSFLIPAVFTLGLALTYVSIPAIREAHRALKQVQGQIRYLTLHFHDEEGNPIYQQQAHSAACHDSAMIDADIANLLADLERYLNDGLTNRSGPPTPGYLSPLSASGHFGFANSQSHNASLSAAGATLYEIGQRSISENFENGEQRGVPMVGGHRVSLSYGQINDDMNMASSNCSNYGSSYQPSYRGSPSLGSPMKTKLSYESNNSLMDYHQQQRLGLIGGGALKKNNSQPNSPTMKQIQTREKSSPLFKSHGSMSESGTSREQQQHRHYRTTSSTGKLNVKRTSTTSNSSLANTNNININGVINKCQLPAYTRRHSVCGGACKTTSAHPKLYRPKSKTNSPAISDSQDLIQFDDRSVYDSSNDVAEIGTNSSIYPTIPVVTTDIYSSHPQLAGSQPDSGRILVDVLASGSNYYDEADEYEGLQRSASPSSYYNDTTNELSPLLSIATNDSLFGANEIANNRVRRSQSYDQTCARCNNTTPVQGQPASNSNIKLHHSRDSIRIDTMGTPLGSNRSTSVATQSPSIFPNLPSFSSIFNRITGNGGSASGTPASANASNVCLPGSKRTLASSTVLSGSNTGSNINLHRRTGSVGNISSFNSPQNAGLGNVLARLTGTPIRSVTLGENGAVHVVLQTQTQPNSDNGDVETGLGGQ